MTRFTFIPQQLSVPYTLGVPAETQRRLNDIALDYAHSDLSPELLARIGSVCTTDSDKLYAGYVLASTRFAGLVDAYPNVKAVALRESQYVDFEMVA